MSAQTLLGAEKVLDMADRMRRSGGAQPHRLHHEAVEAFRRGELGFEQVLPLYRHAMIHAGCVVRKGGIPFRVCPECEASLDIPRDGM